MSNHFAGFGDCRDNIILGCRSSFDGNSLILKVSFHRPDALEKKKKIFSSGKKKSLKKNNLPGSLASAFSIAEEHPEQVMATPMTT